VDTTLHQAVRRIEALIDLVGRATLYLMLAMIALVAVNVLLRYSLSLGSVWAQELEWHLLAAVILFGMSYALQRGDNVRVDVFYADFKPAPSSSSTLFRACSRWPSRCCSSSCLWAMWRSPLRSARPRPIPAAYRCAGS
jgi:TRAP-type mannitol/chloroaromatic compound transport system permease small subunit